jgi:outer membrane lipoprotein-sorting protein
LLVVIILLGNLVDFVSTGFAESTPSQEQGQEKKAKDVTVLQGKSDMNIMGLSPNEVVVADGKKVVIYLILKHLSNLQTL